MLVNSDIYLCSQFVTAISPQSPLEKLTMIPLNMQRTSPTTFMLCDQNGSNTTIVERTVQGEIKTIEEFEGNYTSWSFHDDYAFLLNREGDVLFYNLLSRNVFQAEKQHPGQYVDAHILHSGEHFITVGGCVKNPITNTNERILKVWAIDSQDSLIQQARINTGHARPIEGSLIINNSKVITMSSDKTLRCINLINEQVESIINTNT